MNKQVGVALEVVASKLGGTWQRSNENHDAEITVGGKRIVVDVVVLKRSGAGEHQIRLRFDKVVFRLMQHLQNQVGQNLPDGRMALLTVTAPIRLPSKTAVAIEEKIRSAGEQNSTRATIHGNRVRIRILRHGSPALPKVIGFVHNPDSDPRPLLKMTADLVGRIRHDRSKLTTSPAVERALILADSEGISEVSAYRHVCSELHLAAVFQKIFVVFNKQRVEALEGFK
jgi:hypothetical protein